MDIIANANDILGVFDLMFGQLGDMQQSFEARLEADKNSKIRDLGNLASDNLSRLIFSRNVTRPGIFIQLLQSECDPVAFLVH